MKTPEKIFNPAALAEIIELEDSGEAGLVDDLIRDYLANYPNLLTKLEQAASANDFTLLERTAHSIKSSSTLLGLELTAEVALGIEYDAHENRFDLSRVEMLKMRIETGRREIERFRLSRMAK